MIYAMNVTVFFGICTWIWKINREVGELKAWQEAAETRCKEHNRQLGKLFEKADEIKDAVAANAARTAEAVGTLVGKVDTLIQKGQD